MPDHRTFLLSEPNAVPALSLFLGFGAMVPFAVGGAAALLLPEPGRAIARHATLLWGSSILLFLSGVRRGVSFRTPAGPTTAQITSMLWLFLLGLGAMVLMPGMLATVPLIAGYLSIAVLDPVAARRGEVPLFFAHLRPVQMAIPIVSLTVLAIR